MIIDGVTDPSRISVCFDTCHTHDAGYTTKEDFDAVIEINLKSVFNMTKAVQKIMLKNRKGSIINMSSVVGVKGNAGQANYAASKAGMIGFTKSIALELGSRNIRCNAIAPGFIETEMTHKLKDDVRNANDFLVVEANRQKIKRQKQFTLLQKIKQKNIKSL